MPKRKAPPLDAKAQSQHFKDMAKQVAADESGKKFEKSISAILSKETKPDAQKG